VKFREQGQKVQCIRSTYQPSKKSSIQQVIVSFDRSMVFGEKAQDIPSVVDLSSLTDSERRELDRFLTKRRAELDAARKSNALWEAGKGGGTLAVLAAAIRSVDGLSADQAATIWAGLADVAGALREAGFAVPVGLWDTSHAPASVDMFHGATGV